MRTRTSNDSAGPRILRWLRAEAMPLLAIVLLMTVARSSFANHYVVPTGSMEPTLMPGDRVAVNMMAYGLRLPFTDIALTTGTDPQPGDVVVFDSPRDGTRLIKRIVAVAGDRVELRDGCLAINGRWLHAGTAPVVETFGNTHAVLNLADGGGADIAALTIPAGQALVLGDHRGSSADGRYFGLVPLQAFYGKAVAVYYRRGEGPVWNRL